MAIGLAFGTEVNKGINVDVPVNGYIMQNGFCTQVIEDCDDTGSINCTYGTTGLLVHKIQQSSTVCLDVYKDRP